MLLLERWPGLFRNITKSGVPFVLVQDGAIFVMNINSQAVYFRESVSIYQEQIFPAIVVEIKKSRAPTDVTRVVPETGIKRHIVKITFAAVAV